ncbi:MAG: HD-GYP domain-containing protein [Acidobacteriota bacterium]|nr:HD-GYP domain-containing protein [Acidobacteriota bacterium]
MIWWAAAWLVLGVAQYGLGRLADGRWEQPGLLFVFVLVAASGCVVSSAAVLARAWRSGVAELAALGAFFMGVSLLPLAHGLTVPGVLYGPNQGTAAAVYWAVPVGSVLVWPTLFPNRRWANRVMSYWRPLVSVALAAQVAVCVSVLAWPSWPPAPTTGSATAALWVAPNLGFCLLVSYRHLRLGWMAGSAAPLAVSASGALLAASNLVFTARGPWTAAFWTAHLLDACAVFAGTITAAVVYRRSDAHSALMASVDAVTPLRAVELGLDPLVRRFVADLERKDPVTREHVVRSAHMAARVAQELRLPFGQVRAIGVAALLHDLGKLEVPDEILNKKGPLDADEYQVVQRHPLDGARLVLTSPALADLAPIIRGHHERLDGNGYPDRLAGDTIPIGARVVAACDAYDAMANTRQYRAGMGQQRALAILAEHAGTQWDPRVVAAVTRVVRARSGAFENDAFSNIGREEGAAGPGWCGCGDALPAELVQAGG